MRHAALVLTLVLNSIFGTEAAEAFDCNGVTLPSSIVICSDPELMRLADERQEAINETRGRIWGRGVACPVRKPTGLGAILRPGLRHPTRSATTDAGSGVNPRVFRACRGSANFLHSGLRRARIGISADRARFRLRRGSATALTDDLR
jgi:hypothetical protein